MFGWWKIFETNTSNGDRAPKRFGFVSLLSAHVRKRAGVGHLAQILSWNPEACRKRSSQPYRGARRLGERVCRPNQRQVRSQEWGGSVQGYEQNRPGIPTGSTNPQKTGDAYKNFIDDLYFLFRESVGTRLNGVWPQSFVHVNELRTDLRRDVDHGDAGKVRAKRRKAGSTFALYGGTGTPDTIESVKFPLVQSNVLNAIDLRAILLKGF
jgi:hypothetical protein